MSYFKKLFTSKTRKTFLFLDVMCYALIFTLCLLAAGTISNLSVALLVATRLVILVVLLLAFKVHNTIDTGLGCIVKIAFSVFFTSFAASSIEIIIFDLQITHYTKSLPYDMLVFIALFVTRALYNYYIHEYRKAINRDSKKRALIVGAGVAAATLIKELDDFESQYRPVCLVDDDEHKIGTKLGGIPVMGNIDAVPELALTQDIHTIIIAIPSSTIEKMSRILDICSKTNCFLQTLPSITEIMQHNGKVVDSIKDIKMEDLLGREPITVDTTKVREMVCGKVCMVTGGGGSIGSELCRQIMKYNPSLLVIVDIYENNAYDIQQEIRSKYGSGAPLAVEIASVRDYDKLEKLFARYRPQLVFHAAAHKHVPLMEYSAEEAIKNNVFGTYNTAELAIKYNTDRFLLISTDKAVNPTNVMGASKRCCERVIKYFANKNSHTIFATVRFGNVLGSNGSVVPLFERQIQKGGPITVTHPDITRYFMTIPEAVSLVLQAETMAESGQIYVLDMGKPVKIVTLAENLIKMCGLRPYKDIKIEFVGLREGEKLFEELRMDEEEIIPTYNNKIFIGSHIDIPEDFVDDLETLRKYADANDSENVISQLEKIVPTFVPDKRIH